MILLTTIAAIEYSPDEVPKITGALRTNSSKATKCNFPQTNIAEQLL